MAYTSMLRCSFGQKVDIDQALLGHLPLAANACKVRLVLLAARDMALFLAALFIWDPYAIIQVCGRVRTTCM
jgi:hypothetical protein